ncbi:MAG: glycosyltransferase family 4 protein [Candidatus Omnitrophica bacterium]|nr:glycosyltransferase family 4 protein [Candidatus Omnitrophota bacterium]
MKVLYLTVGNGNHDRRFLVKLAERGYETCLVYFHPDGRQYEGLKGIQPFYIGNGKAPKGAWAKGVDYLRMYRALSRLIMKLKPDVVHGGWVLNAGFLGALTGFKPYILMPWGSDILEHPDESRIWRAMARYSIRRSSLITVDAETVKKKILELVPSYPAERITVFPWGIDLGVFHPDPAGRAEVRRALGWKDRKILIMTRYFQPVYGIDVFLKALPEVKKSHPGIGVLLAGSGPLKGELEALVQRLGLSDVVRFLGETRPQELARYLQAADLYVTTSYTDGTSVSLIEALASALPVVTTDVPSLLEWVKEGENGRVVPCGDVNGVGQAVRWHLEHPEDSRQMGGRNLGLARERADWDHNFSLLEGMYREALQMHAGGGQL